MSVSEKEAVLGQIDVCNKWRDRLTEKLATAISRENEALRGDLRKMHYIDESTHLQLIHAVDDLAKVINQLTDQGTTYMSWENALKIRKAQELRQVALVQLKRAGVTVELPKP